MKRNKIELLAPAGDKEKMKYAFAYGADAAYLGLPEFSLRAKTGFDFATLSEAIKSAHKLKKKVYITVNIFAHENQIEKLPAFLKKLKDCRPDAVILSDPGVLALVKKAMPKTPIHLSTQANTLNSEAVKFWAKNGVSRIILGREASLSDIKRIKKAAPKMELEVFVHGAMCLSYSGRCYLSAELSDRSANIGLCTQPCRWQYNMYAEEVTRPGRFFPIEEDAKGMYFMNSKDLCLIDYMAELVKAGVTSFKIEGRTKSHYYVATVIRAYDSVLKKLGDKKVLAEAKKELQKIDNREYTTGFMFDIDKRKRQNFETAKVKSDWQLVGEIILAKSGQAQIKVHNTLKTGEAVELMTPENIFKFKVMKILDEKNGKIEEAHGGTKNVFTINLPKNISTNLGLLRKKV